MSWLCKIGIHWARIGLETLFVDKVNGNEVFMSKCPCGIEWMHQSIFRSIFCWKTRIKP